MTVKSGTLRHCYRDWQQIATAEQLAFVASVYAECEAHYAAGGDTVVECFTPSEIVAKFTSLADVRDYCGLKVEQELNTRWGEDDDPQLKRMADYNEWNERKDG